MMMMMMILMIIMIIRMIAILLLVLLLVLAFLVLCSDFFVLVPSFWSLRSGSFVPGSALS